MTASTAQAGRRAAALLAAVLGAVPAIVVAQPDSSQKTRPTEGDSTVFDGYGDAEVLYVDSPDGLVRVWYALSGPHAPPSTDVDPADGVPDFVQTVALRADEVAASLVDDGFRLPLADDAVSGAADDGGSSAFDIYLVDFRRADGLFFAEGCLDTEPLQCTGYIAIKNNFSGSGYASIDEAVTVLVSHEYFHAVQAAYSAELPAWLSEGTATWHEEYFDPTQNDFERLANSYFETRGRSLNGVVGGPTDLFSYGAAVFPLFLEQTQGVGVLVDAFEAIAAGRDIEQTIIDAVEVDRPFDEAFAEFAAWTLCTGERANDSFGFAMAAQLDELELIELDGAADLNWDTEVRSWAHEPAALSHPRPVRLEVRAIDGWPEPPLLVVVDPDAPGEFAVARVGEVVDLPASGSPAWIAMVNPDPSSRIAGRLAVRAIPDDACAGDDAPDCLPDGSGDDVNTEEPPEDAGCSAVAGPTPELALLGPLMALLARRRRRLAAATAAS